MAIVINSIKPCSAQVTSLNDPVVHLQNQGDIQGYYSDNLAIFKGVPYAAAPTDQNRWLPPQPALGWGQITRLAKDFGPNCSQKLNPEDNNNNLRLTSEDCLYLNIWTPKNIFEQPDLQYHFPVMVWIHGGAFVTGGTSKTIYDGNKIAQQGVIVVTINYRLGRFGFFAHPALKKENEENNWVNYGLMDQIAALQWIKKNIAAFGGDNTNVTLFGESAGGASILALMTSMDTEDLFSKVIIQSGTGHSQAYSPTPLNTAETIGLNFATKHRIFGNNSQTLQQLRKLTSQEIVDNLSLQDLQPNYFAGLTIDGILLKQKLDDAYQQGLFSPKPSLIGDNDGDYLTLSPPPLNELAKELGTDIQDINKIYNPSGKESEKSTAYKILADLQIIEPTRKLEIQVSQKNVPVYRYRFSYIPSSVRAYTHYGAPHASEIPFVFDNLDQQYKTFSAQDEAMAKLMMTSWVNFAKSGNPSIAGFDQFKPFTKNSQNLFHFSMQGVHFEKDPFASRLDFIEKCLRMKH
ncbi:Fumonisin B1 esterase [Commensalibacter sp. Nvir]|uniref:carboxylesterase/lipase family protein n=1 Tax=Commensalibacter sp. Nvir TaxID=3069817 RepID=UPI002D42EAAB|nr:Fumonisin B1 esterase [Commensalibacter sp. Nvir]